MTSLNNETSRKKKTPIDADLEQSWYEYPVVPFVLVLVVALFWVSWLFWGAALTRSELERHAATAHDLKLLSLARKSKAHVTEADPTLTPSIPAQAVILIQAQAPKEPKETADENRAANLTELGQAGDAFGGFNAFFASLAGAAVLWAGALQYKALKRATSAYKAERYNTRFEQAQSIFFNLLELTRQLCSQVSANVREHRAQGAVDIAKHGPDALDAIAHGIWHRAARTNKTGIYLLKFAVNDYKDRFNVHTATLGPYWRLLFQTFQALDSGGLDDQHHLRFAKIARAQLSEGTTLLLALNGLTYFGNDFVNFINKYGLLEHMHPAYLDTFDEALRLTYQPHAFLGSLARSKLPPFLPNVASTEFDERPSQPRTSSSRIYEYEG